MKKHLFLFAAAALVLASCSSDDTIAENSSVGSNQQKEIAFTAFNQKATRAAVDGTTFPTTLDMKVAAYQVEATGGSAGAYFDATTFKYQYAGGSASGSGSYWGGTTARYWPLTPAYINFLAIANANEDDATGVTWGTNKADQVTIVMSDNSSAQRDLMYARGNGAVTQDGNTLTFPSKVDMTFKHAQAWIDFKVKANGTPETGITVNSITLTGAKYNGTYTVTHTAYNAKTGQSVAGAWSALGAAQNIAVPGWSATALTTSLVTVGNGLMIVPDDTETGDFTSFTINYTFDGKTYTYTYTPASTQVEQAKHYIYEITFKLHEIFINPTVEDWADQSATAVSIAD